MKQSDMPTPKRTLRLHHLVYMGLAWMMPMVYFTVYGIAREHSGGMLTQAYLLAFAAIFFTAFSYSAMAKAFPGSGSAYSYVGKSLHPRAGFLVGWTLLLEYVFSPLIAVLTFGIFMHAQFPSVPAWPWIVGFNILLAAINMIGVSFSANISKWFVWLQVAFVAVFCAFLAKGLTGGNDPLAPLVQTDIPPSALLIGASVICFCFLGFDSVTTLSEETIEPRKTIPKAILIIISVAGLLYFVPSYLTQLAYPGLTLGNDDAAGRNVVELAGGAGLSSLFMTVLVFAVFTQGLASSATASRLLYAMGRDAVLPRRVFGRLHPRFGTPVLSIAVVSAFSMLSLAVELDTAVKFVNFGALTAFFFVNVSVVAKLYFKDRQRASFKQTVGHLVVPAIGACFIGWLLTLLDATTLWLGLSWTAFGVAYYVARFKLYPMVSSRPTRQSSSPAT
ncbi:APC family permease [Cohnella sp. GCM10027633]|uniref:APC family permease n=1 Tax=unclassified Cohnella TaxID=2636738 RepID=UPI003643264D